MQPVGADTSALKERRPAPDFFILSREQHKSRVWVCDDNISDIFHVKNDCPDFIACGSTMRNVSLARAIEDYGRYNCMTCSAELSAIFDEEKLRITN